MSAKKNAINISIGMILFSLIIIALCWHGRNEGATELLFVLASGVFGSSFATLWIFIYEYHQAKYVLLKSIFDEVVSIMETDSLPFLERFGFHDAGIKESMVGKYYIPPTTQEDVRTMDKETVCHYELCRFVDAILDIGCDKINHICDMVEQIDFWSDTFRRRSKYRDMIVRKISLPLYEVFISAPAMEDGYIFRYFKDFKTSYEYTADQVYDFVCEIDRAMHRTDGIITFGWQKRNNNLRLHVHEQMWIFRDAFYNTHICRKHHRMALNAFMKDTPYPYIR